MRVTSLFILFLSFFSKRKSVHVALLAALPLVLSACSGSNKDHPINQDDHGHNHNIAARLIYALDSSSDTLKMFDQTLENPAFANTTVAANANAQLVLANDGLTIAMLEGGNLSVVSSGLEHVNGNHPHTHNLSLVTASPFTGVQQVIASGKYFSTLESDGSSRLIDSAGAHVEKTWTDVVYPTLALEGGDFLTFTADSTNGNLINISVVDQNGNTGADGLIFVRPNTEGYMTKSISCVDGVLSTAQTEDFTLILCGDGSLRWLISGYDAPEGHPQAGKTLHVTQRYPSTGDRREGAIGEVTTGATGFIENITGLTATHHDDNVIAAWSADQLWLINAHNDHPHRGDFRSMMGNDFGNILAVAATSHEDALAVLSHSGNVAISRFEVSNNNPVAKGKVALESVYSHANWTEADATLLAGAKGFFVAAKRNNDGVIYQLDFHGEEGEYHLHGTHVDSSLKNLGSAVLAHVIDDEHEHDHDHN